MEKLISVTTIEKFSEAKLILDSFPAELRDKILEIEQIDGVEFKIYMQASITDKKRAELSVPSGVQEIKTEENSISILYSSIIIVFKISPYSPYSIVINNQFSL